MIRAIRDGVTRNFQESLWKAMPAHKHGWKQKAEEPEEVSKLRKTKVSIAVPPQPTKEVTEKENEKDEISLLRLELPGDKLHNSVRRRLEARLEQLLKGKNAADNKQEDEKAISGIESGTTENVG